ncbi:starch-binding domain-containing protein 1 [Ranitomeya variabilis]|uniref:starch-binding domain-containing protein 1 n=1 Tax=Ranitomeya variabilis TaxID=490064 RepID=UPI0040571FC4
MAECGPSLTLAAGEMRWPPLAADPVSESRREGGSPAADPILDGGEETTGLCALGGSGTVQEAPHLDSPIQGSLLSGSLSSMWPVLAIGIFTAIVAWIWYLGSGERKEPGAPVQKHETAVPAESVQCEPGPEHVRPACGEQESAQSKSRLNTQLTTAEPNLSGADPCEHGVPCPKIHEVLHPGVFEAQNDTKEEHLADVDPLDLKVQSNIEAETNTSPSVLAEVGAGERLAEVGAGERLAEVARRVQLQGDTQEHTAPALSADIKQRPTDLEPDFQEHLPDATERDQQADLLGAQANAQGCPGVGTHSTGVLAAGSTLSDGDQEFGLQVGEDVVCPPVMAPAAERVLSDSGSTSRSDLGKAPVHQGDGEERVNGEAETGPGGQLENSSFVKENAINVLESKETLKQESHREISMSSDIDQFIKDESLEKCDIKRTSECNDIVKPSTRSHEDADISDGSLNTSSEALCDFQKLGTYPESSSMEMHNLFNQEKAVSGLSSSNSNEKNSVYGSSEANINEADNQKTKKVATIQPMPQNVNFGLKVHYITHSDSQIIAVTGDHEKLGKWETYVPLTSGKDGFWSHAMTLPADTNVAWKFIMVENGKIRRWEECNNRLLKITHEDIEGQLFWGYPIM